MAPVLIHGNSFDPADPSTLGPAVDESNPKYIIIQVTDSLQDDQKASLTESGCSIQRILADNTYLCRCGIRSLENVRKLPFVLHAQPYHPALKVQSSLRSSMRVSLPLTPSVETSTMHTPSAVAPPALDVAVMISLHDDSEQSPEALAEQLSREHLIDETRTRIVAKRIDTLASSNTIDTIAATETVRAIERHYMDKPMDERSRTLVNAILYSPENDLTVPDSDNEYLGQGQVIHIADTGFDTGTLQVSHPGFGQGRLLGLYNPFHPIDPQPEFLKDVDGHGTHVCGCALLDYSTTNMAGVNCDRAGKVRGIAPAAEFVSTNLTTGDSTWTGGMAEVLDVPYDKHGARISNYSFGHNPPQDPYDAKSDELDGYLFDRNELVFVQAAGNERSTKYTAEVTGKAACKNIITVGNSLAAQRMNVAKDQAGKAVFDPVDGVEVDSFRMRVTSNRGPTLEGRIKPDVAAPGTLILSSSSSVAPKPDPPENGPSKDGNLHFAAGTSQSAPVVAGCAALLRQTLSKNGVSRPTAALIKALLVNGAVDMSLLVTKFGPVPNPDEGFGRVNLTGSLCSIPKSARGGFVEKPTPLKPGEISASVIVIVGAPLEIGTGGDTCGWTLKVTLVWTDRPGAALVNRLGLAVTVPSDERRHGNKGTQDMRQSPDEFDKANNVQQVVWKNIPKGIARITVKCVSTVQDPTVTYALAWSLQ